MPEQNEYDTDVLIIGAGPAGSVSAALLQQKGYRVRVIERENFPRFVIGESLLPRCMEHLQAAGFMDALEASGFQKKYGAKFLWGDRVCDFDFENAYSNGWSWTWQVPRADFDNLLIKEVIKMGAQVDFNTTVIDAEFPKQGPLVRVKHQDGNEEEIRPRFVIDASGYGRVLPRILGLDKPSDFPRRKAIFTHVEEPERPEGSESNRISIITLSQNLWAWLIPFSNGITSMGFVGDEAEFDHLNKNPDEAIQQLMEMDPYIFKRMSGHPLVFPAKVIEGYSSSVTRYYGDAYVLTGNSTEFLDPIFSSGVTFAIESGAKAAELIDEQLRGEIVDWDARYVKHIQAGVDVFRNYVKCWYDGTLPNIFFSELPNPEFKRQICSVLAGYVWDQENPFVKKSDTLLHTLSKVISIGES